MNSEQENIKRCQKGDLERFAPLYEDYFDKIYRFIFFKVYHKELAEDLTGQVFMKALEKIGSFSGKKAGFSTWLYQIARNTVIDYYRTRKESFGVDNFFNLASSERTDTSAEAKDKIKEAKDYLKKLTDEQKEIVIMRIWDELSYKEISQIIGKSESNCKVIFSRSIHKLKGEVGALLISIIMLKSLL